MKSNDILYFIVWQLN